MAKRSVYKKICVLLTVLSIAIAMFANFNIDNAVYAVNNIEFEKTNVLDDLKSSTVNGVKFDIKNYPFDEDKDLKLIDFVEFCYSFKKSMQANYGLYVYIYNPKGLNLSTDSNSNKIQMAVKYDANGNAVGYEKFHLKFCNKTEDSVYKNLFYKFKVIDKEINNTTFFDRVNSIERRYDVSSIELMTIGQTTANDYPVGGTYKFTGYAKGCGPDSTANNTLNCNIDFLETISPTVRHTFYRSQTSSKGAGYQNQLDTVYFSVPKRFFDLYGKLQRIKAEWYEYKTKDIIVTSNLDFKNKAEPYLGVKTGNINNFGFEEYNQDIGISLGQDVANYGDGSRGAKWGWNLPTSYEVGYPCNFLYYLFYVNDIKAYDPNTYNVDSGGVSNNDLYDYIMTYTKTHNNGYLPIKNSTISADLFASDIDDYRKVDNKYGKVQNGYSYYDFDADIDLQKLTSWVDGNPSFWDNMINYGLWNAIFGVPQEESKTVPPIYTLKDTDLQGTNAEVSERLLINVNDVKGLQDFYNDAVTVNGKNDEEEVVVLFRFATTDYYSAEVSIVGWRQGAFGKDSFINGQAYRAWESVFLDFDIIQLTFNKKGVYRVIPVVANPIDIVDSVTPPPNFGEDDPLGKIIALILGLLLLIVLLVVFAPILPYILQGIVWVVMLPVKAVVGLYNGAKDLTNKKKRK